MGLLDNYTGIGMSPRPKWQHQGVIRNAICLTQEELTEQNLFMLSEATVTDNWDDLAPDLVVFDAVNRVHVVIEITTHNECKQIIRKCQELIARFPEAEYFVYDYERKILHAYDSSSQAWYSSENEEIYSQYLAYPLICYLEGK